MEDQPRVLVVQHLEPEGPALLAAVLEAAGCRLDVVRVDLGQDLPPDLSDHAGLVVMGGPMSAASDEDFPTRSDELVLLADALDRQTPTLGVCLGAQLLAVAAGAQVIRGLSFEIGWGSVRVETGAAGDSLLDGIGDELTVLHWHGETFDLPPGAVHLASSVDYANQAFRLGPAAWGLQFHIEVHLDAVEGFVDAFPHDASLAEGGAEGIRHGAAAALARSEAARTSILERFAEMVAHG